MKIYFVGQICNLEMIVQNIHAIGIKRIFLRFNYLLSTTTDNMVAVRNLWSE